MIPDKAFILAAGYGKRMRPYTDQKPKPMLEIAGQSLINRSIEKLNNVGVTDIAVNTHYKAEMLKNHLPENIKRFHEETLLDTGGGIKNALKFFKDDPFFVLSGDGFWLDEPGKNSLKTLSETWNPEIMDILLFLQPVNTMHLTKGIGDYDLDDQNRAIRSKDKNGAYMWTSMRIHHPRIFENTPTGAFSYLELLDKAQADKRLYGLIHSGDWHHISTPQDLDKVNETIEMQKKTA